MGAVACGEYRSRRPELSALYGAFREGWPQVESEASFRGGVPKRVKEEVQRYLRCGILRYGFGQLKCGDCHESVLVAFSCKSRGWCPGCGTRRSWETASHCEAVLPELGYRQWTLSLPRELRWWVMKKPSLLRAMERRLVREFGGGRAAWPSGWASGDD